ncbi:unnamed protein product [Discula destructiva]
MLRMHVSPVVPLLAMFLLLCYIGIGSNHKESSDRADGPLLAYRNDGHRRGLKNLRSPTGTYPTPPLSTGSTSPPPPPTETCFNPPKTQVVLLDGADALCQCSNSTYYASQYYRLTYAYTGKARCEATLKPVYANQTQSVPGGVESFSLCMERCVGSFDKRKRDAAAGVAGQEGAAVEARQYTPYWFCHGVNYIPGELCEFVGPVGSYEFPTPGVQSWDNGLTDGTWDGF